MLIAFAALGCGQSMRPDPEAQGGATATDSHAGAPAGGTAQTGGSVNGGSMNGGTANGGTANGGMANTAGAESGGAGASGPVPAVDVSGNWAMFRFEDPVAVSLIQRGTELSGMGCCAGLGTEQVLDCCGSIIGGSIIGRNVAFAFSFEFGPIVTYAADVFVSADGQRMAGRFHDVNAWGGPTAWVRIGANDAWLPQPNVALPAAIRSLAGRFELVLDSTTSVGAFLPSTAYLLSVSFGSSRAMLSGDLGAFWEGELSWNDNDETLIAGPVAETHPDLPTELHLRFEAETLIDVVATLPSGDRATFSPRR